MLHSILLHLHYTDEGIIHLIIFLLYSIKLHYTEVLPRPGGRGGEALSTVTIATTMPMPIVVVVVVVVVLLLLIKKLAILITIKITKVIPPGCQSPRGRRRRPGAGGSHYGQFSKSQVCFGGLDSGNLKFETVRTHKQHICF